MKKLVAYYYLRKVQKRRPQFRFQLHVAQSGSIYVQRKRHGYIDYVRIADHAHNTKQPKKRSGWFQKRFLYLYIDIKKTNGNICEF